MKRLIVLGAGGHGAVVADIASIVWPAVQIAFLDDRHPGLTSVWEWPVLGPLSALETLVDADTAFLVGIGNNTVRGRWIGRIHSLGGAVQTLIHPSAVVSVRSSLGAGTVVLANAVVQIGARVGKGGIINTAAVVEHDCVVGDAVHICPQVALAGNVTVGDRSTLGVGSSVRHGIVIGRDVVLGAASAVVQNIPDDTLAYGVPAKIKLEN